MTVLVELLDSIIGIEPSQNLIDNFSKLDKSRVVKSFRIIQEQQKRFNKNNGDHSRSRNKSQNLEKGTCQAHILVQLRKLAIMNSRIMMMKNL